MTATVVDDIMHEASRNESFLMRFKQDPGTTLNSHDAAAGLSDEEHEALVERDEGGIHEEVSGLRTDLLVAVAVTVIVVDR
ncbi:MAG: hypothetical protein ABEH66_01770 [Halobacteriales archaeon]